MSSDYVQVPGESDYVKVGELQVSRARLMATVVNKLVNDERKSGFLVIDDCTETIRVRGWEEQHKLIDSVNIGDLIDVIGRVRRYNEEVYLIPEIIKKSGANWFALRKIEMSNKDKPKLEFKEAASLSSEEPVSKDLMFSLIKKNDKGQGAELKDLLEQSKLGREECLKVIRDLMADGVVFEPKSNKFKALD